MEFKRVVKVSALLRPPLEEQSLFADIIVKEECNTSSNQPIQPHLRFRGLAVVVIIASTADNESPSQSVTTVVLWLRTQQKDSS
ncbi:hypothetical protein MUK42_05699 [Musa troglodytarum]|uniref:Uncharacterized protein n=1 Tax=Musa troglodytarum TaxID=320322 RepID=A0A9E7K7F7_9LILI|nr:hypothetical protein MUK42_05699 [Musa troglodytarum]